MKCLAFALLLLVPCVEAATLAAPTVIHRESVLGEFSDDHQNPTPFTMVDGVNRFIFTIGGGPVTGGGATNGSDADFIRFELALGQSIDSICVTDTDGFHFFGAIQLDFFPFAPENNPSSLFAQFLSGQAVFGEGDDLLDGFPTLDTLTENTSFLFQETAAAFVDVTIDVNVVTIPEPSAGFFFAAVVGCFVLRRSRTRD
ncbi:MAG: hypothetical protein AAGA58_11885 [Verrucomicrobiota bacterium]